MDQLIETFWFAPWALLYLAVGFLVVGHFDRKPHSRLCYWIGISLFRMVLVLFTWVVLIPLIYYSALLKRRGDFEPF